MKLATTLPRKDPTELLAKGISAREYTSLRSMLGSVKSKDLAVEIANCCLDKYSGRVMYIKHGDYVVIVLPDHVHVLKRGPRGLVQPTQEEATRVVEELKRIMT